MGGTLKNDYDLASNNNISDVGMSPISHSPTSLSHALRLKHIFRNPKKKIMQINGELNVLTNGKRKSEEKKEAVRS